MTNTPIPRQTRNIGKEFQQISELINLAKQINGIDGDEQAAVLIAKTHELITHSRRNEGKTLR